MKVNPPEIPVKISKEILKVLLQYLRECTYARKGFTGVNNFARYEPVREALILFVINSLVEKIAAKLYRFAYYNESKTLTIRLTHAERIALSVMFNRVELPSELYPLQQIVLNKLIIEK